MRFCFAVVGLAVVLAGCQSIGPIEARDSMLRVELADGEWPTISRELVEVQGYREEAWDWPSGALRLIHARRMYYYTNDYTDPEDLVGSAGSWPISLQTAIPLDAVKTGENADGAFRYATAATPDRICFFMLQAIPLVRPPNTVPVGPTEKSDGYYAFYHCAATEAASLAEIEAEGLTLANALVRNW